MERVGEYGHRYENRQTKTDRKKMTMNRQRGRYVVRKQLRGIR